MPSRAIQWAQLVVLTVTHATGDLFNSILLPIVPVLCAQYGLSFSRAVAIITVGNIAANAVQLLAAHFRTSWRHPGLLVAGVLCAGVSAFTPYAPVGPWSFAVLAALMLVTGAGVAVVHPEGLRAVHQLGRLPPAVATAVFMVGGFAGYAGGALASARLVEAGGLPGLTWLLIAPAVCAALVWLFRIRLAVEGAPDAEEATPPDSYEIPRLPFPHLFAMACLVATSATLLSTLLPTRLHEAGFPIRAGGMAVFVFGIGGAVGSLVWSAWAPRLGYVRTLVVSLACGLPLMMLYLLIATSHAYALVLLAAASFCVYAAYPLLVTLARHAESGLRFSQRMALIVGGAWGTASVVLWLMGVVSDHVGVGPVLHLVWVCYAAAALHAAWLLRRTGGKGMA